MRASTNTALIAALLSRAPLWQADLFTIALLDGTVLRWNSADQSVIYNGDTWIATGPALQRSQWKSTCTTEVPELSITLLSNGADFLPGNIKTLLHDGYFDGAVIQLERAFMPVFGNIALGTAILFAGRVGKIEITSLGATLSVTASTVSLTQYVPRNTYQLGCIHTLFDNGCTLSRESLTASYTINLVNSVYIGVEGGILEDPASYMLGTMAVTSGKGIGQTRTISNFSAVAVGLIYPLSVVPAVGDTVSLTQGCDKTLARCTVLTNTANFRGYPLIPAAILGI